MTSTDTISQSLEKAKERSRVKRFALGILRIMILFVRAGLCLSFLFDAVVDFLLHQYSKSAWALVFGIAVCPGWDAHWLNE